MAALLAWWAAAGDGGAPTTSYVVAANQIGPGERITADHLALTTVELTAALRRSAFTSPGSVVGSVATGPIAPGELVQAGAIAPGVDPAEERELTFPVAATWAVGGALQAGDRIDVYATYGDGTSSLTRRVLAGATVRRVEMVTSDRMGDSGQQTITVGLGSDIAVARVVNAVQSAELTVARVSGDATTDGARGHDRYDASTELSTDPAAAAGESTDEPTP